MSLHYSWINLTCLVCIIDEDEYIKSDDITGNFKPIGTGFIVFYKNIPYLVTARHLIQKEGHLKLNLACIFDYITDIESGSKKEVLILDKIKYKWFFHKDDELIYGQGNNYLIDIAVTKIQDTDNISKALHWNLNDIKHQPTYMDTSTGIEIRVIGYPLAFTSFNDYSPTIRRGILARRIDNRTTFLNKDIPDCSYLIDCFIDKGNSGSPVIRIPTEKLTSLSTHPGWDTNTEGLIGIATGHFASEKVHAGLGICIPTQYIFDIIKDIKYYDELKFMYSKLDREL